MVSAVSSISSMIERPAGVAGVSSFGISPGAGASGVSPVSFGDVMSQVATNAIDTMKAGEAASISGVQGKASVQQVVEAVMSAEQTLQTAIAIRDKVVAAYQEIARMAI
ncbi:flagellar hook-basal body complex protein FliE [Microvirga zambiensis]|uniref:flagellar hook-basal body complex protein FliE n=1 Tax=Microvirga zambiensis TaxID=1402137 RepID=UPI00191ED09D|nr:flagellar hook-basal body complex protein FliE [Microvirga zambiensis]